MHTNSGSRVTFIRLGCALLAIVSGALSADVGINTDSEPKNALGVSIGWVPGNGISYRRYFGDQFIQSTFVARLNRADTEYKNDGTEYLDIGIVYGSYLHYVKNDKFVAPVGLKWTTGLEYYHYLNKYSRNCFFNEQGCSIGSVVVDKTGQNTLYFGAGIGLDFGRIKRKGLILSVDLNYFISYDFQNDSMEVGPGAELGLLYNY